MLEQTKPESLSISKITIITKIWKGKGVSHVHVYPFGSLNLWKGEHSRAGQVSVTRNTKRQGRSALMHTLQVSFAQQPSALKQTKLKHLSTTKSPKCGEGASFAHVYPLCATSMCAEAVMSE